MTFTAPSCDFYDDGLVHAHDWSRTTAPGGHHAEGKRASHPQTGHDHDDGLVHEHRWARQ